MSQDASARGGEAIPALAPEMQKRRIPDGSQVAAGPPVPSRPKRIPADDDDVEYDVWYGGYCGRAMVGSFVACIAVTAVLIAAPWEQGIPIDSGVATALVAGLVAAVWIWQLIRWGYRVVAYQIRLTSRRLFFDRGWLYPDRLAIELASVCRAESRANLVERLLGVGRVYVYTEDPTSLRLVLPAIRQPAAIASTIAEYIASARQARVIVDRIEA